MCRFLIIRLSYCLAVLLTIATLTFVLMHIAPGGPFDREKQLPPQVLANITAKYYLDQPVMSQYIHYLNRLSRGDLGPSYKYLDRTVTDIIIASLPISALLGFLALTLALLISLPAGLLAAYFHNSWIDRCCLLLATLGISLPHFILGALLIWTFSLQLGWFQAARWGSMTSAVLPAITLGSAPAAYLTYLFRSTLIETLGEDFIRTARAKGLKESFVILKHALRNSLTPILTIIGPLLATLVTGSFIVEYVFAIPGMGRFFITAVIDRDYPMIMGVTLVYSGILVVANLVVDILYTITDPRVKTH